MTRSQATPDAARVQPDSVCDVRHVASLQVITCQEDILAQQELLLTQLHTHADHVDHRPGHEGREVKDGGADCSDLCVGEQRSDLHGTPGLFNSGLQMRQVSTWRLAAHARPGLNGMKV